jgi:hypothetical protein
VDELLVTNFAFILIWQCDSMQGRPILRTTLQNHKVLLRWKPCANPNYNSFLCSILQRPRDGLIDRREFSFVYRKRFSGVVIGANIMYFILRACMVRICRRKFSESFNRLFSEKRGRAISIKLGRCKLYLNANV